MHVSNAGLTTGQAVGMPPWLPGAFYGPAGQTGVLAIGANRLCFVDLDVPAAGSRTISSVSIEVTGAGTGSEVLRYGFYTMGSDGLPESLLVDAGTVSATTTGLKTISLDYTFSPGCVYVAYVPQVVTTNPQIRTINGMSHRIGTSVGTSTQGRCYYQDGVSGALPATATPLTISAAGPQMKVRAA